MVSVLPVRTELSNLDFEATATFPNAVQDITFDASHCRIEHARLSGLRILWCGILVCSRTQEQTGIVPIAFIHRFGDV